MDTARVTLEARISPLLDWEKRKRREATLTVALFYAFLAALAVPLFVALSPVWAWAAPAAIFAVLTPWLLFTRRWREQDTARALAALDRTLRLDERATTAWELSRRNETKAVALLVVRQANDMLQSFDARRLFPRRWKRNWYAWLLPPLLALWLAMLHFDTRFDLQAVAPRHSPSLARDVRELARELLQKAQSDRLPQTQAAARALEKVAERGIDAGTADEAFKSELAGVSKKLAVERTPAGQVALKAESGRELKNLRAELEAARESFEAADGEAQGWQERLAGLSQLKKQLDRQQGGARQLSRAELKALVDKLEEAVTGELDRRALAETEERLKALTQRGQSEHRDARGRPGSNGERDKAAEGPRDLGPGNAPGDAPGEKSGPPSLPQFQGEPRAQVKGTIGEGERSATFFKAKPAPGKSRLSQDEVISSYRRQAESELDTEKIPGELKDTIKNYFLSLEKAK